MSNFHPIATHKMKTPARGVNLSLKEFSEQNKLRATASDGQVYVDEATIEPND